MKVYQVLLKYKISQLSAESVVLAASSGIALEDLNEIDEQINKISAYIPYADIKESGPYYSFFALKSVKNCFFYDRLINKENNQHILHGLIIDEMLP